MTTQILSACVEYRAELVRLRAENEALKVEVSGRSSIVAMLRAENEALRADKERLDWLEQANVEVAEELIRIGWNPATDAQWEKQTAFLSRIRAFIDAARKEAR